MRFLIDAQLPPALCDWFHERGHDAVHVRDALGGQTPDRAIADHAERLDFILVTKDDDFQLRHPPIRYRLIWLRCGNITNRALRLWLDSVWAAIEVRLAQGDAMIEVR